MDQDELDKIRKIAGRFPKEFRLTQAVIDQRDRLIETIERLGENHDSLVSMTHYNFAQSLENCDMMLRRVFGTESKQNETVFNFISIPEGRRDQSGERLSVEYKVQSAV